MISSTIKLFTPNCEMSAKLQRFSKSLPGALNMVEGSVLVMPRKFRPALEQKQWRARQFREILENSRFYALFHCFQVIDVMKIRSSIEDIGGRVFVIKNSVARLVTQGSERPEHRRISGLFRGPGLFVYLDPDTSKDNHILQKESKYAEATLTKLTRQLEKHPDLMAIAAVLDGSVIERKELIELSKKKDLSGISMLGSMLASLPHMKLPQLLNSHQSELIRILNERVKQLEPSVP